jgi:50S ribosomal protein L16 3-hydroxylase
MRSIKSGLGSPILGGLSPAAFLRDYWQKRPLLIRQALPGFTGFLDRDAVLALATRSDAISRLVLEHPRRRSRWERHDGPFGGLDATMLPKSHWTVLIHGVESLVRGGWELLHQLEFIPAARIDDLMVSYGAPQGSVGAHVDDYDVFLLQGAGRRRWQVSTGGERVFDPDAAIKVLKSFVPEEEWLLEPGDMLYLPPGVAHWGVAESACLTYSIGFLAPTHEELIHSFLGYLGEALVPSLDPRARYADPDLRPAKRPLEIADGMVDQVAAVLERIRWDEPGVAEFLGRYLTSPNRSAVFTPPKRPSSKSELARRLRGRGRITLALPSRGLVRKKQLFLNGGAHAASRSTLALFERLVRERSLALPIALDAGALELVYGWYLSGFLFVEK